MRNSFLSLGMVVLLSIAVQAKAEDAGLEQATADSSVASQAIEQGAGESASNVTDVLKEVSTEDAITENISSGESSIAADVSNDVTNISDAPKSLSLDSGSEGTGIPVGDAPSGETGISDAPKGLSLGNDNKLSGQGSGDVDGPAGSEGAEDAKSLLDGLCQFAKDHECELKIVGFSTGAAITVALVTKIYNDQTGKQISKKKAALLAGALTALTTTGYYYGSDMLEYVQSFFVSN